MTFDEIMSAMGPGAPTVKNERGGSQAHLPFRADLLDGVALLRLAGILKKGADKYGVDNWRRITANEHLNHAMCHVLAHLADRGTKGTRGTDDHLGHAFCRLMMAVAQDMEPDEAIQAHAGTLRVYLAGPMTGRPGYNHETFTTVAKTLRKAGAYVENPAETDGGSTDKPRAYYMRKALQKMLACDQLVLLPGWSGSRGAVVETAVAMELSMPIYVLDGPVGEDSLSLRLLDRDAPDYGVLIEISHGSTHPEEDTINARIRKAFTQYSYACSTGEPGGNRAGTGGPPAGERPDAPASPAGL